jgi:hypothetical protein
MGGKLTSAPCNELEMSIAAGTVEGATSASAADVVPSVDETSGTLSNCSNTEQVDGPQNGEISMDMLPPVKDTGGMWFGCVFVHWV